MLSMAVEPDVRQLPEAKRNRIEQRIKKLRLGGIELCPQFLPWSASFFGDRFEFERLHPCRGSVGGLAATHAYRSVA